MLRKGRNRARLHPIKETGPAGKRRRMNKNKEYIDVQPVRTNPAKQKRMNNKENESKRTRTATTESSRPPRGPQIVPMENNLTLRTMMALQAMTCR